MSEAERQKRIDDNLKAVDECVTLGTDTLVLVGGGLLSKDITEARSMVYDGVAAVVPYAQERVSTWASSRCILCTKQTEALL